ncbi:hypothetical protein AAHA92_17279 [Salvia divinorum]|uniref:Uncharacterized protein n=1 Tax=Salvia divinorum TaxID=28513 RepID=A0ABD1H1R3_SALDI
MSKVVFLRLTDVYIVLLRRVTERVLRVWIEKLFKEIPKLLRLRWDEDVAIPPRSLSLARRRAVTQTQWETGIREAIGIKVVVGCQSREMPHGGSTPISAGRSRTRIHLPSQQAMRSHKKRDPTGQTRIMRGKTTGIEAKAISPIGQVETSKTSMSPLISEGSRAIKVPVAISTQGIGSSQQYSRQQNRQTDDLVGELLNSQQNLQNNMMSNNDVVHRLQD